MNRIGNSRAVISSVLLLFGTTCHSMEWKAVGQPAGELERSGLPLKLEPGSSEYRELMPRWEFAPGQALRSGSVYELVIEARALTSRTAESTTLKVVVGKVGPSGEFKMLYRYGPALAGTHETYRKTSGRTGLTFQKWREEIKSYFDILKSDFNYVVFENALKWQAWSGEWGGFRRNDVFTLIDWLNVHGLEVKGHTLVWPGWKYSPAFAKGMADRPEQLNRLVHAHISELGSAMNGNVVAFDVNLADEQLQAEFTRDFLTAWFAHPDTQAFLQWGFWQGSHWLPYGGLYDLDWRMKPKAEVYRDLVFNQWWTGWKEGVSDVSGRVHMKGFLGAYKVSAYFQGREVSLENVELKQDGTSLSIRL